MSPVLGAALVGVDGVPIEVEVHISPGLPRVDIVGLPEAAVRESSARVRSAISALGVEFPRQRITVNLAPASLRKGGAGLDLPIALGILAARRVFDLAALEGTTFVGELALDGRVRSVRGALALVIAAREAGSREVIVPRVNGAEAALAPGVIVRTAADLGSVVGHLAKDICLERPSAPPLATGPSDVSCLSDVCAQDLAKRALEVTAAGSHALLMSGPPGSGKTMLARRLPGILPPLSFEEALEATRIHGAAGRLDPSQPIVCERPFRSPHHTASTAGLLGGGNPPLPGEISLAHQGVLFLDELPEFARSSLEALREVIEERRVTIARARASCVFPARFLLIAASNPCPCGWYGSGQRDCRCDERAIARYVRRLSGPLLDRIDLHVRVSSVAWSELESANRGPTSRETRERVIAARGKQARRGGRSNAEIPDAALDELVAATPEARDLLGRAVDRLKLSARGARRVLRVSRTIADLAGEPRVGPGAVAEAIGYRLGREEEERHARRH